MLLAKMLFFQLKVIPFRHLVIILYFEFLWAKCVIWLHVLEQNLNKCSETTQTQAMQNLQ